MRSIGFVLALLLLPALVLAQVPTPDDPGAFLAALLAAVQGGQWVVVSILAAIGLVYVARRFGAKYVPFLATRRGGAVLLLLASVLTSLAVPVLSGTALTLKVIIDVIVTGIGAAGGRTILRSLLLGGEADDAPASGGGA